jgi:hypothetical protein
LRVPAARHRTLAVFLFGIGIGCGGGNAPSIKRDAGPDAIPGDRLLRTLDFSELAALCAEVNGYLDSNRLAATDLCRGSGFDTAVGQFFSQPNISDAALQTACVLGYASCLSTAPDAGVPLSIFLFCTAVNPGCPATVDEHWACIYDLVETERARIHAMPLCHMVTRDVVTGRVFDAGMPPGPPASCAPLVNNCSFGF